MDCTINIILGSLLLIILIVFIIVLCVYPNSENTSNSLKSESISPNSKRNGVKYKNMGPIYNSQTNTYYGKQFLDSVSSQLTEEYPYISGQPLFYFYPPNTTDKDEELNRHVLNQNTGIYADIIPIPLEITEKNSKINGVESSTKYTLNMLTKSLDIIEPKCVGYTIDILKNGTVYTYKYNVDDYLNINFGGKV